MLQNIQTFIALKLLFVFFIILLFGCLMQTTSLQNTNDSSDRLFVGTFIFTFLFCLVDIYQFSKSILD